MSDKILFIDVSSLKKVSESQAEAVFIGENHFFCKFTKEAEAKVVSDTLEYLSLSKLQCQIIRDNIVEIIRFADTGRL